MKTMRVSVEWNNGEVVETKAPMYTGKSAYFTLQKEVEHLKRLTMTTNWSVYDDETGELLASKNPETNVQKAQRLYDTHKNYAKVARIMGYNPTTIRTWLKSKDTEEN